MAAIDPVSPDSIRAMFASALSSMYRREVPQYGTLLKLVVLGSIDGRAWEDETETGA
jgi:uncharacterized glyoxalase superfamily metalloenzyme YdcJ